MTQQNKKIRLTIEMEITEDYFNSNFMQIGKDIQEGIFQKKLIEGNEPKVIQLDAKLEVW